MKLVIIDDDGQKYLVADQDDLQKSTKSIDMFMRIVEDIRAAAIVSADN